MNLPIAPEPQPGAIERSFRNKSFLEIAVLKANALVSAGKQLPSFEKDGLIIGFPRAPEVNEEGQLLVWLQASGPNFLSIPERYKDGTLVQPFIFTNVPIRVPDGTAHLETSSTGESIAIQNFKEDAIEALKIVLVNAVLDSKKNWQL